MEEAPEEAGGRGCGDNPDIKSRDTHLNLAGGRKVSLFGWFIIVFSTVRSGKGSQPKLPDFMPLSAGRYL